MKRETSEENYQQLLNIGFSLNEAKVYVTLLNHQILNGYEIAKYSGVSRSLVYNVIVRLVDKGYIHKFNGEPNYYSAVNPEEIMKNIRRENEQHLHEAENYLKTTNKIHNESEFIYNIKGFDNFIKKGKELIANAKKEISLSIWKTEFHLLEPGIKEAIKRGVKVFIFSFNSLDSQGATVFSYGVKDPEKLFPYRRLTMVVDNEWVLIGENMSEHTVSIFTKNHAVLSLATDEIVLNVFWQRLINKENFLDRCSTANGFLNVLHELKNRYGIDENMTKNFMVFNFQCKEELNGSE